MTSNDISLEIDEAAAEQKQEWAKQDTLWMLGLYGTAIGAGTLFLPVNAGMHGFWPLVIMALIAFPMTYFSHRALCRFVLSGRSAKSDITDVVVEHFGQLPGKIITWLYFFAIYPILLMYSVAITNTTQSFLVNQLHVSPPPRIILAIVLVSGLMAVVHYGERLIIKSMSILVYPFVCALMMISLYLIPEWNLSAFQQAEALPSAGNSHSLLMTLWLIVPVMVFSFNHSPLISSFAVSQKQRLGSEADRSCSTILKYSHLLMVGTVMFFVFSCVFSLTPQDLLLAKKQNISILSYLANHLDSPMIAWVAPLIAFAAIAKSFFGHYLGAREGLHGLIAKTLRSRGKMLPEKKLHHLIEIFMAVSCIITAVYNPSILGMIEVLGGPVIAIILFLMPMYAIARVPAMQKYRHSFSNAFTVLIGLIAISAIFYGLLR